MAMLILEATAATIAGMCGGYGKSADAMLLLGLVDMLMVNHAEAVLSLRIALLLSEVRALCIVY
jgi:hypothetical protein